MLPKSHKALSLFVAALAFVALPLQAQVQEKGEFSAEIRVSVSLDYLVYVPEEAETKNVPLLLFLHGAGERGDDLEKLKAHGPPKLIEQGKKFPFVVLSPQCPNRSWWRADVLAQFIDFAVAKYPVDKDRIYVTGLSMGGFGTWDLAAKYPGKLAAAAPICGGGEPESAAKMKDLPIWAFHGAKDRVVPVSRSQVMVDALKDAGNECRFTVYPETDHDSWTETYDNPKLYEWLLSHSRGRTAVDSREIPRVAPAEIGLSSEKLTAIDSAVGKYVESKEIAGAVVLVARKGRVALMKAYGKQHIANDTPMDVDTIFRIYSMTKPIASVALMTLYEEGKFSLDDPVSRYIPELKNLKVYSSGTGDELKTEDLQREATIADLLRHTAGLGYGWGAGPVDAMYREAGVLNRGNLKDLVGKLGRIPLHYQPGTRWLYSVSVDVQGYLVEVISGQPFDRFLQEKIFTPLHMHDTGFYVPEDKLDRFAANYGPAGSGALRVVDEPSESRYRKNPEFLSGGGGLVSTARDYLRFCQMVLNGGELDGKRILKPETVAMMTKDQLPEAAFPIRFGPARREGVGFGYGFSVRVKESASESAGRVGEYGWGGAASTHFWISPRDELIVIALSQYMPFSGRLESAVKPIVYEALE